MKVLVISSYEDNWNSVRPEGELLIGMHHQGVDLTIMTQGHAPYAGRFRSEGLPLIDFHPKRKFDKKESDFIREHLRKEKYDLMHLFNNKAIVTGLRAAKGIPIKVLTYRGYAGHIHWYDPTSYLTHLNPRVDGITCVSAAVKKYLDKQLLFDSSKTMVVHKGHDLAWYKEVKSANLEEFNFPQEAIVVNMVANARKMKGLDYLIEASKQLPAEIPLYILLIGRGMDTPAVRQKLKNIGCEYRFRFSGYRKDVLELVKACDISILPSIAGEGLSKVILEAMFLGKPTIMTQIEANKGLAVHGESGFIIPPKDPAAIAEALITLGKDRSLRKQMGKAARSHISEHFNLERSIRKQIEVYQKLLA